MKTKKAGVFLVNAETGNIGLIYRTEQKDYSFPKGHLEPGETLEECAVRETQEETKRDVVLTGVKPIINNYTTPRGEDCECYLYVGLDNGPSDNKSLEVHDLVWVEFDKVEEVLSYENLRELWLSIKPEIAKILNK